MKNRVLRFYHEWVQALPLSAKRLVCTKCDVRKDIGQNVGPCSVGQMVPVSWLPKRERDMESDKS